MTTSQRVSRSSILGFAVGVGACAVAIIAIPLTFWFGGVNHWLIFGLAFAGGALLGAGVAPRALRPPRAPTSAPPSSTHDT